VEQGTEKKIGREYATLTEFGAHLEPALRVEPGETFLVETQDNFFGEIDTEEVLPTPEQLPFLRHQFWKVNPVAGPIYVEGCKAGDLLVLEIVDIIRHL
jgi:amidase